MPTVPGQQPMAGRSQADDSKTAEERNKCALADKVGVHGYWNAIEYCYERYKKEGRPDPRLDLNALPPKGPRPEYVAAVKSIGKALAYVIKPEAATAFARPIPTKTWTGKIGADMYEGERMFNDVEYLVSSDSTIAFLNAKGSPELNAALKQQLEGRSSGERVHAKNGGSLGAFRANLRSMSWEAPLGRSKTRCRVMIWNGNELCVYHDGVHGRVKGARREDTRSDYDEVERDALSMIDDVVDEQAYVANATGDVLVMLALGENYTYAVDFAKYIINAAKVCYELCCPMFDVADRAQGPMMSHVMSTSGRHVRCQVGELLPFGDIEAPQYMPPESANINSKDFLSWLVEHHDDRQAWADRRYTTVPYDDGVDIYGMELEAGSPMEALPFNHNMKNVIGAVEKGTTLLFTAKSRRPAQFYEADDWYDGLKGRVAAREWVLARMRLARSPRSTAQCCQRTAIEYLVTWRLHTSSFANLSCSALFDWGKARLVEHGYCAMLEIPFLWPDGVHDYVRRGEWETLPHVTDVRKLYALLNTGLFLPFRERWGWRVKTEQEAKVKRLAEGVYAFGETDMIYEFHQRYSHGAELWSDGNLVIMDFKVTAPLAVTGGSRPIDAETKGKKQCVCDRPELIVRKSLRLYFMTSSQANQRQLWVFHPQHSRHYEMDYKALVGPSPAPEEDVAQWQIDNAITDQMLMQQPRTDLERATVRRQVRSLFQSTRQKDNVAEFDQLRRIHLRFLEFGDWMHRELYSDLLITEHFDAPILVAHGLQ
ncbi:unnamed protein product, partial [Prorocentrum cordatum]